MAKISSDYSGTTIGIVLGLAGYVAIKGINGLIKVLSKGDFLSSGDHLETGADGEVVVGFADGSTLELDVNAQALLDSEVFDVDTIRDMHGHNGILNSMQQSLLNGDDANLIMQTAEENYASLSGGDNLPPTSSSLPVGGDVEIHTMPEMVLPKITINDINILEPSPGKGSEGGHDSGHDTGSDSGHDSGSDSGHDSGSDSGHDSGSDSGHDSGSDSGHDSGSDSGHDSGSDSGHDSGSDSGHDSGSDSGHDSGSGGAFGAGSGGGYGYAGGNLSSVAVFTVSLSSPATREVRVDFKTIDGTAISGGTGINEADFGQTSGTLVIPAGQSSGTIEVTIVGDKLVEVDEQFFITLSNPVNAMIVDDTSIGNIIDSGHGHGTEGEANIVIGTAGDDVIITKGGADEIDGLAGNDTLIAGGGPDIIHGGEGDDLVVGLGGPDKLYGEEGNDEIVGHGGPDLIDGGAGDDIIYAGGGPDTVTGGSGNDFINAEGGPDLVDGGEGNDVIYGGGGPDTIDGNAGDDVIRGDGGPDVLRGGTGNDEIYGGGGPDVISGGDGADVLKGGGAGDVFKIENLDGEVDRILDFSNHDQIDLSAILEIEEGDVISDYIQISQHPTEETSYELSVNPSGAGFVDGYEPIVILENFQSDPDVDQLVNNGNLIIIE